MKIAFNCFFFVAITVLLIATTVVAIECFLMTTTNLVVAITTSFQEPEKSGTKIKTRHAIQTQFVLSSTTSKTNRLQANLTCETHNYSIKICVFSQFNQKMGDWKSAFRCTLKIDKTIM